MLYNKITAGKVDSFRDTEEKSEVTIAKQIP